MDFDYDDYFEPSAPYAKGSQTSRDAAESLQSREEDVRRIIALFETGNYTREEVVNAIDDKRYNALTPRIWEMASATQCLVPTGEHRKTARGRRSEVLRLVPGTTFESFTEALKAARRRGKGHKKWLEALELAALQWANDPTSETEAAVKKVMLAGKAIKRRNTAG